MTDGKSSAFILHNYPHSRKSAVQLTHYFLRFSPYGGNTTSFSFRQINSKEKKNSVQIENGRFLFNFDDKKTARKDLFCSTSCETSERKVDTEGEGGKCEFKDARGREGSLESRKNRKVGRGTVGRQNGEEGERGRDVFEKESRFGKKKEGAREI